jgi:hypothetical protein
MHRHFSNRGEAHAEVIAARLLAGKGRARKPTLFKQAQPPKQWISHVEERHSMKKPFVKLRSDDESATL